MAEMVKPNKCCLFVQHNFSFWRVHKDGEDFFFFFNASLLKSNLDYMCVKLSLKDLNPAKPHTPQALIHGKHLYLVREEDGKTEHRPRGIKEVAFY